MSWKTGHCREGRESKTKYGDRDYIAIDALMRAFRAQASELVGRAYVQSYEDPAKAKVTEAAGLAYYDCADILEAWLREATRDEDLLTELFGETEL